MEKLVNKWRNLPTEVKTLLAGAGLGSGTAIVFLVAKLLYAVKEGKRFFSTDSSPPSYYYAITSLGILFLGALFYAIGRLVSKVYGLRQKRRGDRMIHDLDGDMDRGPQSMDVRATVKANNKKFFDCIQELRAKTKLRVYDLPWYIVIGDSACGKTQLVKNSKLDFPLGLPEDVNLGTLNYNWWFTEEAIFIDMAGRLVNPQEDADYKEWQGFLNTISKGRPGFPINGAIVCVSADHLLEDPPDKIDNDAHVMLDRLRDLQAKLGVTFATYFVVTKCDKILGFMQFFDRAERNVEVRNQMVGWTRPPPFSDSYDPASFEPEFQKLYHRLNELRVRRLNDEADQEELDTAYCLPEEFLELRDPLMTYINVLFPYVKNPRVIKNLVLRGVYFTSSLQQGNLILKHLKERLGTEAAGSYFKPLEEVFGRSKQKALFIKDLMREKVFPEYGMVFENAGEVQRKKRYSRLLFVWSGVMAVVLFGAMGMGISKFSGIIKDPGEVAKATTQPVKEDTTFVELLGQWNKVDQSIKDLRGKGLWERFQIRMAAPVAALDKPISDLEIVRAGFFQRHVLPGVFKSAKNHLENKSPENPKRQLGLLKGNAPEETAEYESILRAYLRWLAWARTDEPWFKSIPDVSHPPAPKCNMQADLEMLVRHFGPTSTSANQQNPPVAVDTYFKDLMQLKYARSAWPHPAKDLEASAALQESTVIAAIGKLRKHFRDHYATLSENHPDPIIAEWMRVNAACNKFLPSYQDFLRLGSDSKVDTVVALKELKTKGLTSSDSGFQKLKTAVDDIKRWSVPDEKGKPVVIKSLIDEVAVIRRATWCRLLNDLKSDIAGSKILESDSIEALVLGEAESIERELLDKHLGSTLNEYGLLKSHDLQFGGKCSDDPSTWIFDGISRSNPVVAVIPQSTSTASNSVTTNPSITLSLDAAVIWGNVESIKSRIQAIPTEFAASQPAKPSWPEAFEKLTSLNQRTTPLSDLDRLNKKEEWEVGTLEDVNNRVNSWERRARTTALLLQIAEMLTPGTSTANSFYTSLSEPKNNAGGGGNAKNAAGPPRLGGVAKGGAIKPQVPGRALQATWVDANGSSPIDATRLREFMKCAAQFQCQIGLDAQHEFKDKVINGNTPSEECLNLLKSVIDKAFTAYVNAWSEAYGNVDHLDKINELIACQDLKNFKDLLNKHNGDVKEDLETRLGDLVEHVCFASRFAVPDTNDANFNEGKETAARDLRDSLAKKWRSNWTDGEHKSFIEAVAVDESRTSRLVCAELVEGWDSLVAEINAKSPGDKIDGDLAAKFEAARNRNGLNKEKLTNDVLKLAAKAKTLIEQAMKTELCTLQGRLPAYEEGWPYLPNGQVMDKTKFVNFLKSVRELSNTHAQQVKKDPAIEAFVESCNKWHDFLKLDNDGNPAPIKVRIRYVQPKDISGVATFFGKGKLDLGITNVIPNCDFGEVKILVAAQEDTCDGEWNWTSRQGSITLDPLPEQKEKGLKPFTQNFQLSDLYICSLHRGTGIGGRNNPIRVNAWGMANGCSFEITFVDRQPPSPIVPLTCP